jgi:hypothetical protein
MQRGDATRQNGTMDLKHPRGTRPWIAAAFTLLCSPWAHAQSSVAAKQDFLANNTVLIIRHAEKPLTGSELTPAGQARAQAYTRYFEPFREDQLNLSVDALYAGADSESSVRPRQTLEPLSKSTGLKLDTSISTKDPAALVSLLRTAPHGAHPLVAWRHGQIPALLAAFGASPTLLPNSRWPDDTFDWVVVLRFDAAGKLASSQLVKEHLNIPAS